MVVCLVVWLDGKSFGPSVDRSIGPSGNRSVSPCRRSVLSEEVFGMKGLQYCLKITRIQ